MLKSWIFTETDGHLPHLMVFMGKSHDRDPPHGAKEAEEEVARYRATFKHLQEGPSNCSNGHGGQGTMLFSNTLRRVF